MPDQFFSERETGPKPRVVEEFTSAAWGGIVALAQSLISTGAYGADFPDPCPDGQGPVGTDGHALGLAVKAEVPDLPWPLDSVTVPPTAAVLDFIEFSFEHVGQPIQS